MSDNASNDLEGVPAGHQSEPADATSPEDDTTAGGHGNRVITGPTSVGDTSAQGDLTDDDQRKGPGAEEGHLE